MTIRRITLLFISITLLSGTLFSQKVFREGYIIKNTGEAFNGLVGFNPDTKAPAVCIFKRFDIALEITFNPDQVMAFGYINGKRYESLYTEEKKSFFEILVTGDIKIYKRGSKYYLKKGDLPPAEVKDGKNSWIVEGKQKEFSRLSDLLKHLISGSKIEIKDDLVIKNDLIPVISAYNKSTGNPWYVFNQSFSEKELTLSAWRSGANRNRFGVFGGINMYTLKLDPKKPIYIPEPKNETGLMLGLSFERVISRKTDNLGLRADFLFIKQTFYAYSENDRGFGSFFRDDAFFNFSALKVPLLIQYSLTGKRIVPYLNGGVSGMFFLKKDYIHIREVENYSHEIRTFEDNSMVFNLAEASAILGAGMKIRIINNTLLNIEGRFEFGTGVFNKLYPEEGSFLQHSIQSSIHIGVNF